ncbi:MAG TPA: MBOAT family O-acyltransferase [Bacteroidales bacterium]
MVFSSLIFLYVFLPVVLILNWLAGKELRNGLLLFASLAFIAWGGVSLTLILILSLVVNYFTGLLVDFFKEKGKAKIFLIIGLILNFGILGFFKYANWMVDNINFIFSYFGDYHIENPGIILPLGISFYTFQAVSYIVDVYRNEAKVEKNFFTLALYISMFPQLIAGPIVRYQLIAGQLINRPNHRANFTYGIQRFTLGLVKKVLLANQFGSVADQMFGIQVSDINSTSAWIGVFAYTMQIYFDFSGYSDMAIGLGRMLGFRFPENFNFPYISKSVREYWQRWHLTLTAWFKNYLYFPLGGSRGGKSQTIRNLLIVFLATSVWHGASWNFVIWGMTHGVFMLLEYLGWGKILQKLYWPFQHFYALFIIAVTRVFFRSETLEYAWPFFLQLFTFDFEGLPRETIPYVLDIKFFTLSIIGIISSTMFWVWLGNKIETWHKNLPMNYKNLLTNLGQVGLSIVIIFALALCTMMLTSDSYNPFIYFRF